MPAYPVLCEIKLSATEDDLEGLSSDEEKVMDYILTQMTERKANIPNPQLIAEVCSIDTDRFEKALRGLEEKGLLVIRQTGMKQ
jgi:hypothetical protein